jgi:2-(1,2-epoxy-1,2-dihydrophenyl)acetyl-CoA isomerase
MMEPRMQYERATLDIDGPVAVLRMNDPSVLNALSPAMIKDMTEALDALVAQETPPRCLVLTGTGRAFSTGANLQGRGKDGIIRGAGQTLETVFHPFIRRLRDLPCPIVTAVNGPAAGAGMSVALMGDLIFCARSAYFLQAFRRIGLVPDCGSTWLLPRLIGRARAIELSLLGEKLPAETALAWGLVNRVFDDTALLDETLRVAAELANGPTLALGQIRRLYWESPDNSFEQQLDLECRTQRRAGDTDDFREGVTAFLEKRPAKFTGK